MERFVKSLLVLSIIVLTSISILGQNTIAMYDNYLDYCNTPHWIKSEMPYPEYPADAWENYPEGIDTVTLCSGADHMVGEYHHKERKAYIYRLDVCEPTLQGFIEFYKRETK